MDKRPIQSRVKSCSQNTMLGLVAKCDRLRKKAFIPTSSWDPPPTTEIKGMKVTETTRTRKCEAMRDVGTLFGKGMRMSSKCWKRQTSWVVREEANKELPKARRSTPRRMQGLGHQPSGEVGLRCGAPHSANIGHCYARFLLSWSLTSRWGERLWISQNTEHIRQW